MRTLGDMCWLNEYIGIKYVFGGRDRRGVDCYGLCKLVYDEQYSEELPDWVTDVLDLKIRSEEFAKAISSGEFTQKEEPEDSNFVVCYRTRAAHHMGLYYAGGVLHCIEPLGVVYEPLPRFRQRFNKLVFGEWHPCL